MSPSRNRRTFRVFAVALCAVAGLSGCAARDAMRQHAELESPWVESQPYPRLVDSPPPVQTGDFGPATPDPAQGQEVIRELGAAAEQNVIRGAALSDAPPG